MIRRPLLIVGLAGLAVITTMMGRDFPVIYGLVAPAGAVLIAGSMGPYRVETPEDISDGTRIRDADTT